MKILYVATAYAGLDSLLFNGATKIDGLPPQTKVLKALVERGDEIDMIIHSDGEVRQLNIVCDWLKGIKTIKTVFRKQGLMGKLSFINRMNAIVKRYLSEGNYDFVYLVGDACALGARYARLEGVPCGQRLFGSYATWMLERHSKSWCFIRHYPRMIPFYAPKKFLLMTEDGSDMEKTLALLDIKRTHFDAYQWTNGVDFPSEASAEPILGAPDTYLFCGSRLERMKGQKTCIEVLHELDLRGYRDIHLVFAGRVSEPGFDDELRKDAINYSLDERVHFLGSVPQELVGRWAVNSLASLTFNPYSNRGNATIEALASGAVMIAPRADKWIDDLIIDEITGFRVEGVFEAADRIEWLLADEAHSDTIRENARKNTRNVVRTWEERVQMELDLIDSYVYPDMESLRSSLPILRRSDGS
ncbi:glycosyltransferase family 4 protein [Enteroscipio rubneri]|uniref:glycosyltransferase family 4 protein n=1 Tax=Enteroscipio rubneri TaxID=2070686 RepID=UPI003209C6B2